MNAAAIIIAVVSATISFSTLIWQLVLYRLSGSRIVLQMRPAVVDAHGTVATGPERGWTEPGPFNVVDRWSADLVEIRVTNIGRVAASVSNISIDRGRVKWWRPGRSAVRPRAIDLNGAAIDNPIRIEPGSFVNVYYEIWPVITGMRRQGKTNISLRASAEWAGHRVVLSSRRKRLRIGDDQQSIRAHVKVDALNRAYRELWRYMIHDDTLRKSVLFAWYLIQTPLEDGANVDEIQEKLKQVDEDRLWIIARDVHDAYHSE